MNMNKKLGRFKQWAGEKMGGESKTSLSDDFKNMEAEMDLRHQGMDKMHTATNIYIRSVSKRKEQDDKEKMLPLDSLSQSLIYHGEEFEHDSTFGTCLTKFGLANERIARLQDTYVERASATWLETTERSLAQMKDYQVARRKLESRRLAYDATLSKMQKQKREDFRVEEELRAQRVKFEESQEDVQRRMNDIQENENELIHNLTQFLNAELEFHEKARDILLNLRRQWPGESQGRKISNNGSPPRSADLPYSAANIHSNQHVHSRQNSASQPGQHSPEPPAAPTSRIRAPAFESPATLARQRTLAEPPALPANKPRPSPQNTYVDTSASSSYQHESNPASYTSSPDRYHANSSLHDRPTQPSYGARFQESRQGSVSSIHSNNSGPFSNGNGSGNIYIQNNGSGSTASLPRKTAPPPPLSRSSTGLGKKAPPPPPAKRPGLVARE